MGEQLGPTATLTARKRHVCLACGRPIEPGQAYRGWTWKDGGAFCPVRVHPFCDRVLALDAYAAEDGFDQDFVPESIRHGGAARYEPELDGLDPDAAAFGRQMLREYGEADHG